MHLFIYILCMAAVFTLNVVFYGYLPFLVDAAFLSLSVFLLVTGFILRRKVSISIENSGEHAVRGNVFTLLIAVHNESALPLTFGKLRVTYYYGKKKKKIKKKRSFVCGAHHTEQLEITIPCPHCEVISYQIKKIHLYDYIGFFHFTKKTNIQSGIVVMPKLPEIDILSKMSNEVGEEENNLYSQTKPGDDPTEIFAIREYAGGDKIRNIHWKLSSKVGELMVKDYALPLHEQDTIVVDIFRIPDKKDRIADEMFDLLFGLVYAMTSRGYGFLACYLKEGVSFYTKRVETQNDIEQFFLDLYGIKPYEETAEAAAEQYYAAHDKQKNRIFYITGRLNDVVKNRMELLSDLGPVYYLIPGEIFNARMPVKFDRIND